MDDDKKQDKKSFPNSFIWFLMAAFLFALMVQNFVETRYAKVSFSYQLEHLVFLIFNLFNLKIVEKSRSMIT